MTSVDRARSRGLETHRWRVIIERHEDNRPRRKRIFKQRNYYWAREWSCHPGRWFVDKSGYSETLGGALRKAMRWTWGTYEVGARRMEIEYAIQHERTGGMASVEMSDRTMELLG